MKVDYSLTMKGVEEFKIHSFTMKGVEEFKIHSFFFFCSDWGLNLRLCIYYALSISTELNSRGQTHSLITY